MDTRGSCPACGHPDALLALGARRDRLHRWRPWNTTITCLYLCDQCEALVERGEMDSPAEPHHGCSVTPVRGAVSSARSLVTARWSTVAVSALLRGRAGLLAPPLVPR